MKTGLAPSLVRQSLTGHSWLGLAVGALMYLVCLSGTLAVFYQEFERWEQPGVEEYRHYDPALVEAAFNRFLAGGTAVTEHMYLTLPTDTLPRISVSSETGGWFINRDGSRGPRVDHEWTHLLTDLHLYLHLPERWGMIVVSALGALLCGLIVSGFLAHPRIFRDAFSLRLSSRRLEQTDIHNRLSVWGAPFHLMIAVTGAYFGLVLLILSVAAAGSERSREEIVESVFGAEPRLEQSVRTVAVARALNTLEDISPNAEPLFMTLHKAGTAGQFMEIYARHPGRLIYSENYRFDTAGNYLGRAGFSDGDTGKQIVYSVYRLHFGHFGGLGVKILYSVLGLALTIVSVTGVNIWLERRKKRDALEHLWTGMVWGAPAALALTTLTRAVLGIPSTGVFWAGLGAAMLYSLQRTDTRRSRRHLQALTAALIVLSAAVYLLKHGEATWNAAATGVNAVLLACALFFGALARFGRRRNETSAG